MKVSLICTGKTDFSYVRQGMDDYCGRIKHYLPFELIEITDKKLGGRTTAEIIKNQGKSILENIHPGDYLVILDERGKMFDSEQFAGFMQTSMNRSVRRMVFVIGGAWGFSEEVYQRADTRISLSSMTFSHQIVRLIFLEQLYRAFTIIRGESYHHS